MINLKNQSLGKAVVQIRNSVYLKIQGGLVVSLELQPHRLDQTISRTCLK